MSELGEAVDAALTREWRSLTEIADSIPRDGRKDATSHREMVRKHLSRLERHGSAEKRVVRGGPGGRMSEWRLKA